MLYKKMYSKWQDHNLYFYPIIIRRIKLTRLEDLRSTKFWLRKEGLKDVR